MIQKLNDVINLADEDEILQLSLKLKCPKAVVLYCSNQVGPSVKAIDFYWSMNKEWLMKYKGNRELVEK